MGLDMYLWSRKSATNNAPAEEGRRIGYWRKHPDLHSFIESKWVEAGRPNIEGGYFGEDTDFNCISFRLSKELVEEIIHLSETASLPGSPGGFFFGQSYPEDNDSTVTQMKEALELIEQGEEVFYDSWW